MLLLGGDFGFHRLAPPRHQCIEQAGNGALEMLESSIEFGIAAAILDQPARMRRRRPVAGEQCSNLGEAQAAALKAAATCWRSSARRLGPSEGALYRVTGAMTSIGISA